MGSPPIRRAEDVVVACRMAARRAAAQRARGARPKAVNGQVVCPPFGVCSGYRLGDRACTQWCIDRANSRGVVDERLLNQQQRSSDPRPGSRLLLHEKKHPGGPIDGHTAARSSAEDGATLRRQGQQVPTHHASMSTTMPTASPTPRYSQSHLKRQASDGPVRSPRRRCGAACSQDLKRQSTRRVAECADAVP